MRRSWHSPPCFKRIELLWSSIAQNVFSSFVVLFLILFFASFFKSFAVLHRARNGKVQERHAFGRRKIKKELPRNKSTADRKQKTRREFDSLELATVDQVSVPSTAKWWVFVIVPNRNGRVHRNYEQFGLFINYAVAATTAAAVAAAVTT